MLQHRHGPDLWREFTERLELVGETAHYLYADSGVHLARAYAKPDEAAAFLGVHAYETIPIHARDPNPD